MAIPIAVAGVQMNQQAAQSKIATGQAKVEGEQIQLGAKQREADRKERLAMALASQNASAGAGGIAAFEGSPLTIMKEDMRREKEATSRDKFMADLGVMTSKARASVKKTGLRNQSLLTAANLATEFVADG